MVRASYPSCEGCSACHFVPASLKEPGVDQAREPVGADGVPVVDLDQQRLALRGDAKVHGVRSGHLALAAFQRLVVDRLADGCEGIAAVMTDAARLVVPDEAPVLADKVDLVADDAGRVVWVRCHGEA